MRFKQKFLEISNKNNSLLCVGLDIDNEKMPKFLLETSKNPFFDFNKSIINSTKDLVCAYKLNMAFYEVFGKMGVEILEKTIEYIPRDIIIILDGKRNDIGSTARKYAQSVFNHYKADATTINPYLGFDSVMPFLEYVDKCSFILCRTSNPSSIDFQNLLISSIPLYQKVAKKIKEWNEKDNCGAVAGATFPDELKKVRDILGENIPILVPGLGTQGGNVELTIKYGSNKKGEMAIFNSSRGIIYASNDDNFQEKSRDEAVSLRDKINKIRTEI